MIWFRKIRPLPGRNWCAALALAAAIAGPALAGDGDPDPAFGGGDGKVVLSFDEPADATAVEALPNGRLLVAGPRWGVPFVWGVERLDDAGLPDGLSTTVDFGPEGALYTAHLYDLAIDAESRILLAGYVEDQDEEARPALARLTPAGALDTTFDGDGLQIVTAIPSGWSSVHFRHARLLPDGRAAYFGDCGACVDATNGIFVLRTTAAGAPDSSFAGDGWLPFRVTGLDSVGAEVLDFAADGTITAAASGFNSFVSQLLVVRILANGSFDLQFGEGKNGVSELLNATGRVPAAISVDRGSGRIVVGTAAAGAIGEGGLLAYTAAGAIDDSFGASGFVDLDIEEGARIDAVAIQSDGKVIAAGTINANGTQPAGFLLARTLSNGSLDPAFDGNGLKRVEFDRTTEAEDRAKAATLSGGRLVVVGTARGASLDDAWAILRTESALVFTDGFESGDTGGWAGH